MKARCLVCSRRLGKRAIYLYETRDGAAGVCSRRCLDAYSGPPADLSDCPCEAHR